MEHINSKPVSWKVSCIADLDEKRQGEIFKSSQFTNMSIKISNFKHVGLNILLLFILLAVVESNIAGPQSQREVVSIYNDNFATPLSRPHYFIEVYRCVKVAFGGCPSGHEAYPVPSKTEEVEIVVPDITNKDRDNKKKFYKYVVYNHTSCQCGNFAYRNSKLYKKITNNKVSEDYFKANYSNNPVNLLRLCDVCNSSQPRYKLHTKHNYAIPTFKYLAYQQCLPGCVVVKKNTSNKKTTLTNGGEDNVPLTNDILCKAYDGTKAKTQHTTRKPGNLQGSPEDQVGNSLDQESNYEILVYIGSGKVILAVFLLSLVLFTILIMDFTLCGRKKGFLYALVGCKNDDVDHFCQRCSQINRDEITV